MRQKLTKKQKLALYGLVKYPEHNDREVAAKMRMKLSTLTTIRYKMEQEDYYRVVQVPLLNRLGYEIFAVFTIRIMAEGDKSKISFKKNEFPNIFWAINDQNRLLALGFYPDFTLAMNDYHAFIKKLNTMGVLARSGHWYRFFSLRNDEIPVFFEFAPHISMGFELGRQASQSMRGSQFTGDQVSLSSYERKVLRAMVEHPDESDVKISGDLRVTRSTVARIRDRLVRTCMKAIKIVDLSKLRFKVLTLVCPTLHFHSAAERKNLLASMQKVGPLVFSASGDFNFCMCYGFMEAKGIRSEIKNALYSAQLKKGIQSEIMIATFNLRNVNWVRNHEYVGLVDQMLQRLPPTPKRRKRKIKKKDSD